MSDVIDVVILHGREQRWRLFLRHAALQAIAIRVEIARDVERMARQASHHFIRFFTRSSTTAGSARVLVSPRLETSFSAILRRMRRMILPERVFGSPGANC